ncbi:MAG: ATP-binding protein [Chitinophagales bacterium]
MQFKDVVAQDALKEQLIKGADTEKVSQANLFLGVEGSGTLPLALAYAQYLNCENRQEADSCGVCSSCIKMSKFIHPDVFYTYPSIKAGALSKDYITEWRKALSNNPYLSLTDWLAFLDNVNKQGNITANECDQIVKQHSLKHYEGKYKIQIIWMAEFLKKEGNKLLKIIEEPPENTVFLLLAENIEEILITILSRTQVVKFPRLQEKIIAQNLVSRLSVEAEKARKIAQIVEGNWNAAIQLASTNEETSFEEMFEWFHLLLQRNKNLEIIQNLVTWVEKMGATGRENQKMFLKHTLFFLRECLIFNTGLTSRLNEEEKILAKDVIKRVSLEEISKMSELINNLHYEILRNANAKIGLMSASFEIAGYLNSK